MNPHLHEQDWRTFLRNGRPICDTYCVIWCEVFFENDPTIFFFRQRSYAEHAEHLTLIKIVQNEKIRQRRARQVTMYCSYSPCLACASQMVQFVQDRPNMRLTLVFTSLYLHGVPSQRHGLLILALQREICMRVVAAGDWAYLNSLRENKNCVENNEEVIRREAWDSLWSSQLTVAVANNMQALLTHDTMRTTVDMRVAASQQAGQLGVFDEHHVVMSTSRFAGGVSGEYHHAN